GSPTGTAQSSAVKEADSAPPRAEGAPAMTGALPLSATFWRYLGVLFVFTLGASSDTFLLLRARQLGVPMAIIPILYAAFNLVKAASSTPGGALSDRFGRRPLM